MKLIVNDIAASEGGALSVIKDFYQFINDNEIGKQIEWLFILNTQLFEETSNIKIRIFKKGHFSWLRRLWFDNFIINRISKEYNADGIISFQNTVSFTSRLPQMVYMHQVIPFQKEKRFSFFKKSEYFYAISQYIIGFIIKRSIRKADVAVVQSAWLKQLVASQTDSKLNKIIVNPIECSIDTEAVLNSVSEEFNHTHFFYPAFECIYKNQQVIRQACAILENKGIDVTVELTIDSQYPESKSIKSCGKLPHEQVMKKLCRATLIFPSYLETVGLPLVEAMSVNALILAADCQYARETLNGYPNAYFFNPFDSEGLATLMEKVASGNIAKTKYTYHQTSRKSDWGNVINIFSDVIRNNK